MEIGNEVGVLFLVIENQQTAQENQQRKDTPMVGKHSEEGESKAVFYGCLEAYTRQKIREWLQDLLEQEVTGLLGGEGEEREESEGRKPA